MAKRELLWAPLLGQYMQLSGAVFVDRRNNKNAVAALAAAGADMKTKGVGTCGRKGVPSSADCVLWEFPRVRYRYGCSQRGLGILPRNPICCRSRRVHSISL